MALIIKFAEPERTEKFPTWDHSNKDAEIMLVTNKEEQKMCMEEIVGCKNPMLFGINAEKKLVLQNHWTSD